MWRNEASQSYNEEKEEVFMTNFERTFVIIIVQLQARQYRYWSATENSAAEFSEL